MSSTTRAALAYVADKSAALGEFHRILKPAGIYSAAEPVFRDAATEAVHLTALVKGQPAGAELSLRDLLQRWKASGAIVSGNGPFGVSPGTSSITSARSSMP
jgi:arsenite methyltransferase